MSKITLESLVQLCIRGPTTPPPPPPWTSPWIPTKNNKKMHEIFFQFALLSQKKRSPCKFRNFIKNSPHSITESGLHNLYINYMHTFCSLKYHFGEIKICILYLSKIIKPLKNRPEFPIKPYCFLLYFSLCTLQLYLWT